MKLRHAMFAAQIATDDVLTNKGAGGGAPGTIRTCNLLIRSQMLYPLSYGRMFSPAQVIRTPGGTRGSYLRGIRA